MPGRSPGDKLSLPAPEPEALDLSRALTREIAAEIAASGPLSSERFWQLALYHSTLGYYHNGLAKFGAGGDFITAPELGDGLAYCLARWCAPLLAQLPTPTILETGAGTGALAASLLSALDSHGCPPDAYWILEVSGSLRTRQRETIEERVPQALERVRWLDAPPNEPWSGVILGNEVVDALPPRRLIYQEDRWHELVVALAEDELVWERGPASDADLPTEASQPGYVTEDVPMLAPWLQAITEQLQRGALALIDYGYTRREYYHPQRSSGTAIAHYRHRAHDQLLWMPGLQDLSVSVDFSAVAQALHLAGMTPVGFTSQAQFLLAFGLTDYAAAAGLDGSPQSLATVQEVKQLTLPSEMGERFQVLLAQRDLELPSLPVNQLHRL